MNKADQDLQPLSHDEVKQNLKDLPGWKFANDMISKTFVFPSFTDGINLIDKLAPYCNQIDHHPDIHIFYKKIRFDLQRFSVGGKVTTRDFIVARKIEELYKVFNQ